MNLRVRGFSGGLRGLLMLAGLAGALSGAEQPPGTDAGEIATSSSATNLTVRQVGSDVFELGRVRFNKKEKSVTFPAVVNFREGPVEYLVVTTGGKVHESVFRTDVEPRQIHVAMLLLGAKGAGTNTLPEDPTQSLPGDKISVAVSRQADGKKPQRRAGEEFVRDRKKNAALKKGDWVYNGSRLREDGFAAQQDGSIISLITDPDALVNNPRPGREDDDSWLANPKALPPLETPVEVTLRLKP